MSSNVKSYFEPKTHEFTLASYQMGNQAVLDGLKEQAGERTLAQAEETTAGAFEKVLPQVLLLQGIAPNAADRPLIKRLKDYSLIQAGPGQPQSWKEMISQRWARLRGKPLPDQPATKDCAVLANPKVFSKIENISSTDTHELAQARVTHAESGAVLSFISLSLPYHSISKYVKDIKVQGDAPSEKENILKGNQRLAEAYQKLDQTRTHAAFIGGNFNFLRSQILGGLETLDNFKDPMREVTISTHFDVKEEDSVLRAKKVDYVLMKKSENSKFLPRLLDNIRSIFFRSVKEVRCTHEPVEIFKAPADRSTWPWDLAANASDHRPIFFKVTIETQPSWINRKLLALFNRLFVDQKKT